MITTVLVVPVEGDPAGLLAEGKCGARPPTAYHHPGSIDVIPAPVWLPMHVSPRPGDALVLAWAGKVVPEGRDRAARTLARVEGTALNRQGVAGLLQEAPAHIERCQSYYTQQWRLYAGSVALVTYKYGSATRYAVRGKRWSLPGLNVNEMRSPPGALGLMYALATILVARDLASRVVLLDADGREAAIAR